MQMKITTLDNIKETIGREKPELFEKYGVSKIGVFGSFVFGDYTKTSDIDILVEFSRPIGLFKFIELENYLTKRLHRRVDLVSKDGLKPYIKKDILNSAVYA